MGGAVLVAVLVVDVLLVDFPGGAIFVGSPGGVLVVALGLLAAATSVMRRVWPLGTVLALGLATVGVDVLAGVMDTPIELSYATSFGGVTLLYNAGRWAAPKTMAIASIVALALGPSHWYLNPVERPNIELGVINTLVLLLVVAVGLLARSVVDAKEQRQLSTALQERNLLANDIHDSFAHHMSAIAIRAEAARQLDDAEALDDALRSIKRSASTGLTDLRHFVRGLRTNDDIPRPLPGFGDIQHLASELSNDNLKISVETDAQPEMIPVSVSAAAFWITREALTNIIRHATGATQAHVHTSSTGRHLDLTITDNGVTPNTPVSDRGHGLSSMTARAQALGGDLTAGPNPNGGWLVAARLPLNSTDT